MFALRYNLAGIVTFAALLLSGCYVPDGTPSQTYSPAAPPAWPKPGPDRVSVDSRAVYSAEETPIASSVLVETARRSVGHSRAALNKLVQRWPDVTLEFLRLSLANTADTSLRLIIAEAYDHILETTNPGDGWSAALATGYAQPEAYANFTAQREQVQTLFHNGRFKEAANIDLGGALPPNAPAVLRVEALRLAGLALLLNNQPDSAAKVLANALHEAQTGPRHVLFEIALLASESERRAGNTLPAAQAWSAAMACAPHVRDPELWGRALTTKPANASWPKEAAIAGAEESSLAGIAPDDGSVLIGIGKMRLSRGALQPAFLAFSRAEAESNSPAVKSLAILYRAQTMIGLQQAASALPVLETLANSHDPHIASRATAVKGDVFCRVLNDRQRGIPLMREVLQYTSVGDWPGKDRLVANLGLYVILDGKEDEGLRLLHRAQANFEAAAQWEDLSGSLRNEAATLRILGKTDAAEALRIRADGVLQSAGLTDASNVRTGE